MTTSKKPKYAALVSTSIEYEICAEYFWNLFKYSKNIYVRKDYYKTEKAKKKYAKSWPMFIKLGRVCKAYHIDPIDYIRFVFKQYGVKPISQFVMPVLLNSYVPTNASVINPNALILEKIYNDIDRIRLEFPITSTIESDIITKYDFKLTQFSKYTLCVFASITKLLSTQPDLFFEIFTEISEYNAVKTKVLNLLYSKYDSNITNLHELLLKTETLNVS